MFLFKVSGLVQNSFQHQIMRLTKHGACTVRSFSWKPIFWTSSYICFGVTDIVTIKEFTFVCTTWKFYIAYCCKLLSSFLIVTADDIVST